MSEVLEAQTGREQGSRPSGRLRRSGHVPGVLYGLGMEPIVLAVAWPALRRALNADGGVSSPVRLRVSGQEHLTLVKELQRHPVRRDVIHVDFLAVDPNVSVTVEVPLVLTGLDDMPTALAEKVVLLAHRLEVECKPNAIPNEVALEVSHLPEGGELRVSDLRLPPGVTTSTDPDLVLVSVSGELIDLLEEEVVEDVTEEDGDGGDGAAEAEADS